MAIVLFIHFMHIPQTDANLPPERPAIVEAASTETEPVDELTLRFEKFTTEIIENGLIGKKTEDELIQMLGEFFIQVLAENAFQMKPEVMKHYNGLRAKIEAAFPKPAPEKPVEKISKPGTIVSYVQNKLRSVFKKRNA